MDIANVPKLSRNEAEVLQLLFKKGELHGLGIVTASRWQIPRGSVYRLLHRMERKWLVWSRKEDAGKHPGARRQLYRPTGIGHDAFILWASMRSAGVDRSWAQLRDAVQWTRGNAPPYVKLTNVIIRDAIVARVSEIRIRPRRGGTGMVQYRVAGALSMQMRIDAFELSRVVARMKLLSRMSLIDHDRPQKGNAKVKVRGQLYELRVSTVPGRAGERCVIRVRDRDAA